MLIADRAGLIANDDLQQLEPILTRLSLTLIRRMKADLLSTAVPFPEDDAFIDISQLDQPSRKWQAFPKTLRLSTADRLTMKYGKRLSRSTPMPNFVFSLTARIEETARKLAKESLVPLFKKLHGPDVSGGTKFDIVLMNVAATNMAGGETGAEGGDVAAMFKRYKEVFPEGDWERKRTFSETQDEQDAQIEQLNEETNVEDIGRTSEGLKSEEESVEDIEKRDEDKIQEAYEEEEEDESDDGLLDDDDTSGDGHDVICDVCHIRLPLFAIGAHERFHKDIDGR